MKKRISNKEKGMERFKKLKDLEVAKELETNHVPTKKAFKPEQQHSIPKSRRTPQK